MYFQFGVEHAAVVRAQQHIAASTTYSAALGRSLIGGEVGQLCVEDVEDTVIVDGQYTLGMAGSQGIL